MLKPILAFAPPDAAQQVWDDFVASLYRNGMYRNIGWWRVNDYAALKQKMQRIFDVAFANVEANHVVVIVSDGMPWYHADSFQTGGPTICASTLPTGWPS